MISRRKVYFGGTKISGDEKGNAETIKLGKRRMTNEDVRLRGHSHRPSLPCTTPVGPPRTRCNPESSDTEMSGILEEIEEKK